MDNRLVKAFMLLWGIDFFVDFHQAMYNSPVLSKEYLGLMIGTALILFSQLLFK